MTGQRAGQRVTCRHRGNSTYLRLTHKIAFASYTAFRRSGVDQSEAGLRRFA